MADSKVVHNFLFFQKWYIDWLCEQLQEITIPFLAIAFTEKIDQKICSLQFPYFLRKTLHFELIVFGIPTKTIINAGNFRVFLESAFRPPYVCYSVDVMTQVLSCLKCCSSMKIVIQLFFLAWWSFLFTCHTICPRRDRRGRIHPHPLHLLIHPKA